MIRFRAGRAHRALNYVQPAHIACVGIAALGEIADVSRGTWKSRVKEISIERNNYVRVLQLVLRLDRLAESHLCAFEHIVAIHRLIDVPLRLRI